MSDVRRERDSRDPGAGAVDQVVFRWGGNQGRQDTGMTAVAYSCPPAQAAEMGRELGPFLWVTGSDEPRPSVVRTFTQDGRAVLMQRWPTTDPSGRPSTVSHVLTGRAEILATRLCLSLAHGGWGEQGPAERASGPKDPVTSGRLRETALRHLPEMGQRLPEVEQALVHVTAEWLRDPGKRVSLLADGKPAPGWPDASGAPLLYYGLFLLFREWLPGGWTFATYDTVDSHPLRLTCVPRWESGEGSAGSLARIAPGPPSDGQAHELAGRLVARLLAHGPENPPPLLAGLLPDGAALPWEMRRERLGDALAGDGRRREARSAPPGGASRHREADGRPGTDTRTDADRRRAADRAPDRDAGWDPGPAGTPDPARRDDRWPGAGAPGAAPAQDAGRHRDRDEDRDRERARDSGWNQDRDRERARAWDDRTGNGWNRSGTSQTGPVSDRDRTPDRDSHPDRGLDRERERDRDQDREREREREGAWNDRAGAASLRDEAPRGDRERREGERRFPDGTRPAPGTARRTGERDRDHDRRPDAGPGSGTAGRTDERDRGPLPRAGELLRELPALQDSDRTGPPLPRQPSESPHGTAPAAGPGPAPSNPPQSTPSYPPLHTALRTGSLAGVPSLLGSPGADALLHELRQPDLGMDAVFLLLDELTERLRVHELDQAECHALCTEILRNGLYLLTPDRRWAGTPADPAYLQARASELFDLVVAPRVRDPRHLPELLRLAQRIGREPDSLAGGWLDHVLALPADEIPDLPPVVWQSLLNDARRRSGTPDPAPPVPVAGHARPPLPAVPAPYSSPGYGTGYPESGYGDDGHANRAHPAAGGGGTAHRGDTAGPSQGREPPGTATRFLDELTNRPLLFIGGTVGLIVALLLVIAFLAL